MPNSQNNSFMWVAVGDIHDDTENLKKITELRRCDGIIVTGDLTNLGGIPEAKKIMGELQAYNVPVLAQIGNMDEPAINEWLSEIGVNLHASCTCINQNTALLGVGGSTPTPFKTPSEFPEENFAKWLKDAWDCAKNYAHQLVISHNPPKNTRCDMIPGGMHVGSSALRDFIEAVQPDLCICGHIHESSGTDAIGRTKILNPGPLAAGGYVVITGQPGIINAEIRTV